jgi:hypothetical protein
MEIISHVAITSEIKMVKLEMNIDPENAENDSTEKTVKGFLR